MEFLEDGNYNGIRFMGNGNVYNGYLNQEQTWKEYRQWALCLLYTSPSPRDVEESRMPSSA